MITFRNMTKLNCKSYEDGRPKKDVLRTISMKKKDKSWKGISGFTNTIAESMCGIMESK